MQLSVSWLRQFCNPSLSNTELGEQLTMAGLELEECSPAAPLFTGVVIGEIKACEKHPDADRLRVCQVDLGAAALLQIVCGAPNARVGIRVPVAQVGAELPPSGDDGKPFKIKLGKLRGVESAGMLCSAKELGLPSDAEGLHEFAFDAPLGTNIREFLDLDDALITLKLTPNLGHCLSVYGIAREVAAITGAPLTPPPFTTVTPSITDRIQVQVQAPDLCGRFAGRVVRGVNAAAPTPDWMVQKLARCGQRSVSALVDISNFVMFELGQPSHMFDLDKIQGDLTVRWAKNGESLTLLNGNTIALDERVGVITDEAQVESLAGIMGGAATAVGDSTQNVYIEAAFWQPDAIAGRARRFNFATDAGHRYERGVDFALPPQAVERVTELVLQICGGQAGPLDDAIIALPERAPVQLRVARAAKVIGIPLSAAQCAYAFTRLGLPHQIDGDVISVTPPSYRFDLTIEADLIEEVVRMIGYQNLPLGAPLAPTRARVASETHTGRFALRRQMAALGYQETINFSFIDEEAERTLNGNSQPVRLLNPIAAQMNVMRSSLLPSLLEVLKRNIDRKAPLVRVFEWGRVFHRDSSVKADLAHVQGIQQPMKLAALAWGAPQALQWGLASKAADFYDVKGDIEALFSQYFSTKPAWSAITFEAYTADAAHPALHPGRSAQIFKGGKAIGWLGELHPKWAQEQDLKPAPIVFEIDAAALQSRDLPKAQAVSRIQPVARDLSLVVAEAVTHTQLQAAIASAQDELLQSATLYDIYRPKEGEAAGIAQGEKSVTLELQLCSPSATLTEEQIDAVVQKVLARLQAQVGARLRA